MGNQRRPLLIKNGRLSYNIIIVLLIDFLLLVTFDVFQAINDECRRASYGEASGPQKSNFVRHLRHCDSNKLRVQIRVKETTINENQL